MCDALRAPPGRTVAHALTPSDLSDARFRMIALPPKPPQLVVSSDPSRALAMPVPDPSDKWSQPFYISSRMVGIAHCPPRF